ncbi:nitrate- and nitrite sensing domain-containing protein [Rheinheimera sp. UJ63]|uniref:nitrate- and nitrite sensing domain-containing protein n=1 Tax=Rheinheimera sp. UJ63 TaxID=2910157 RepID=UPI001F397A0D|nr:nitrate- and nitrite sensing domain-containing protein [Rheinheimera sp. UJ63]MCF4008123.1 nitrate- and nitrite sensing domain-containing protein [Rheinheimera sp. UJ63]
MQNALVPAYQVAKPLLTMQVHYSQTTEQFLLAAKQAELSTLQQLSSSTQVVTGISELIHQLQRERGISNIYLASHSEHYSKERTVQLKQTLISEQQLRVILSEHYLPVTLRSGASRLMHGISLSLQGLDNLVALRSLITEQKLTPLQCTEAYCRLISSLLNLVADVAEGAGEPQMTRLLVALFNLMQAKEHAGQERAWGAMGFASGQFDSNICERLQQLQTTQEQQLHLAQSLVDIHLENLFQTEHVQGKTEFVQLRKLIQQLSDGTAVAPVLCEVWFDMASERIDQLYTLEQQVLKHLNSQAQQKLAEGEQAMQQHRQQLRALSQRTSKPEHPSSLLFDPSQPGLFGSKLQPAMAAFTKEGTDLHRTFYDLLQEQAQHIQQMQQQLQDAKQALIAQKQIDRAKLLLMQQSQLSEQQAYRQLQQLAMHSQQSLAVVAATVIETHTRHK